MNVAITKAKMKDLAQLQSLSSELFAFEEQIYNGLQTNWPYSVNGRQYFSQRLYDSQGLIFIASISDEPIGYISGFMSNHTSRTQPLIAEIENMYVRENYRQKQVGLKLMERFIERAKELGAMRLKVGALVDNKLAVDFYLKNGFLPQQTVFEKAI